MCCSIPVHHRLVLAILMYFGLICNYMLRVNINIAIVEMMSDNATNATIGEDVTNATIGEDVTNATIGEDHEINSKTNKTRDDNLGEEELGKDVFNWTEYDKGLILSSFYYTYFLFQVPGGRMAEMFGTKGVFGFTMACTALLAALIPVLAPLGVGAMVTVRVLQGLLEAPSYPVLSFMISKWAPEGEKSSYVSFVMLGGTSGVILSYPLCGMILDAWGWRAVFYVTAGITAVWLLLWIFLVHENPEDHPFISSTELELITSNRSYDYSRRDEEKQVDNFRLFVDAISCPAMLANMFLEFANSWGLTNLLTYGPTFMKQMLYFDIKENGLLSSLPYLCRFLFAQCFGCLSGYLIQKQMISPIRMQKGNEVLATLIPGLGMVWFSFTTEDKYLCVFIMSVSFGFNGASMAGHCLNNITIAPNRAGTSFGLSNGFGSIAGFMAPLAAAAILGEEKNPEEMLRRWKMVLGIPLVLYSAGLAIFCIFGSGEVQNFDKKIYNKKNVVTVEPLPSGQQI